MKCPVSDTWLEQHKVTYNTGNTEMGDHVGGHELSKAEHERQRRRNR